jgi:Xaa-Pro aminopeptidase
LNAQKAVLDKIKPGVQWEELHRIATEVIGQGSVK